MKWPVGVALPAAGTGGAAAHPARWEALWARPGGPACAVRLRAGGGPPEPGSAVAHVGGGEGPLWFRSLVLGSLFD